MPQLSRRELADLVVEHLGDKVDGLTLAAISASLSIASDEMIDLIGQQMEALIVAFESEGVAGVKRVLDELEVPPKLQEMVLAHVPERPAYQDPE